MATLSTAIYPEETDAVYHLFCAPKRLVPQAGAPYRPQTSTRESALVTLSGQPARSSRSTPVSGSRSTSFTSAEESRYRRPGLTGGLPGPRRGPR